jgi:hypothetical protein
VVSLRSSKCRIYVVERGNTLYLNIHRKRFQGVSEMPGRIGEEGGADIAFPRGLCCLKPVGIREDSQEGVFGMLCAGAVLETTVSCSLRWATTESTLCLGAKLASQAGGMSQTVWMLDVGMMTTPARCEGIGFLVGYRPLKVVP